MDWKKEAEFQKAQFLGMFAGLGEDLKITAGLLAVTLPPVIVFLWLLDLAYRLVA
jgi:hypothetical protein